MPVDELDEFESAAEVAVVLDDDVGENGWPSAKMINEKVRKLETGEAELLIIFKSFREF